MTWYDNTYGYKKQVTIDKDKVLEDCTDFPVLISIEDADLLAHAESTNGYDIIFVNSLENAMLDHELETFNSSSGTLVAWVCIPSLSSTDDTIIYMYYGKSGCINQSTTDTWDANYIAVYHLIGSDTIATCNDSTANINTGSWNGQMPTLTAEQKFGNSSQYFDGDGDYITLPAACHIGGTGHTIESWFKISALAPNCTPREGNQIFNSGDVDSSEQIFMSEYDPLCSNFHDYIGVRAGAAQWDIAGTAPDTNWHRWVGAINTNDAVSIFDSATIGTDNSCSVPLAGGAAQWAFIGHKAGSSTRDMLGAIEELRISNIRRTNNWIVTGYNSESSPSTFMGFGAEIPYSTGGACTDSGLRLWDGNNILTLCRDDTSPLKMFDGTNIVGIGLVASASNEASHLRIFDGTNIKSIRKYV